MLRQVLPCPDIGANAWDTRPEYQCP